MVSWQVRVGSDLIDGCGLLWVLLELLKCWEWGWGWGVELVILYLCKGISKTFSQSVSMSVN